MRFPIPPAAIMVSEIKKGRYFRFFGKRRNKTDKAPFRRGETKTVFVNMANHKSSIKRIRSNDKKRLRNRYYHKTTRNAIKKLRLTSDKAEATALFPKVVSMIDKLAKKDVIHKNKAANLKSKLSKHVASLA